MSGPGSRFKGKHSLDSDEEDEGEDTNSSKYDILASDDVEGMSCLLFRFQLYDVINGIEMAFACFDIKIYFNVNFFHIMRS